MKKYHAAALSAFAIYIIIILGYNVLLNFFAGHSFAKLCNIDVNRAYTALLNGENHTAFDVSGYDYIISIEFSDISAAPEETAVFFQSGESTIVYPLYQNEFLTGYVKFNLTGEEQFYTRNIRLTVNILLIVILLFLAAVYLFLQKRIFQPFQRITDLPLALSKGNLTAPIDESPNHYFGNFIWGLNMLRETLESHKENELELQKEKKTLILSLSHDIKTPLNAISLYTKALKENLYADEVKRQELLDNITKQSKDIEGFVNDIIRASKEDFLDIQVPAGEFYLFDLKHLLHDYYDEKLALLKTEFVIDFDDNPLLSGNLDRAVEVLQNIIENAIKYGDGKQIAISAASEEDYWLITVANTGCTLPPGEIIHLFDSFFRGSNVTIQPGSGLGLYICRQILKQMDGDIYAEVSNGRMLVTVVLKMP